MKYGGSNGMYLVIGYGNELRRDDAVGPCVARAVADWALPGVEAVAVRQLLPELAEQVARAREVLFVDAAADDRHVSFRLVESEQRTPVLAHTGSPAELLAVVAALYGRRPRAWLLRVPASDFGLGVGLSPLAARGMAEALRRIHQHITCREKSA
jgi:hydrogenase maturation protease